MSSPLEHFFLKPHPTWNVEPDLAFNLRHLIFPHVSCDMIHVCCAVTSVLIYMFVLVHLCHDWTLLCWQPVYQSTHVTEAPQQKLEWLQREKDL